MTRCNAHGAKYEDVTWRCTRRQRKRDPHGFLVNPTEAVRYFMKRTPSSNLFLTSLIEIKTLHIISREFIICALKTKNTTQSTVLNSLVSNPE